MIYLFFSIHSWSYLCKKTTSIFIQMRHVQNLKNSFIKKLNFKIYSMAKSAYLIPKKVYIYIFKPNTIENRCLSLLRPLRQKFEIKPPSTERIPKNSPPKQKKIWKYVRRRPTSGWIFYTIPAEKSHPSSYFAVGFYGARPCRGLTLLCVTRIWKETIFPPFFSDRAQRARIKIQMLSFNRTLCHFSGPSLASAPVWIFRIRRFEKRRVLLLYNVRIRKIKVRKGQYSVFKKLFYGSGGWNFEFLQ